MLFQPALPFFLPLLPHVMNESVYQYLSVTANKGKGTHFFIGGSVNCRVICQCLSIPMCTSLNPATPHLGFYPQMCLQMNAWESVRESILRAKHAAKHAGCLDASCAHPAGW